MTAPRPLTAREAAAVHVEIGHRLAQGGQRYSSVRRAVVAALARTDGPLSVADLTAAIPDLAVSSAYRNLGVLCDVGAVERVAAGDETGRYELSETVTARHHHHMVCTDCGLVIDYEPPPALERQVTAALTAVADAAGFVTEAHRLDLVGRCAGCAEGDAGG